MLECDYWPVFAEGEYRGSLLLLWDMTERAAEEQERDRRLQAELTSRRAAEHARQRLAEQNDELRELDELKTRFLATVSHELRSPLTSIVSYAELIRDEGGLAPTAARFLDVISRNAERITKLVGDLLLLSRIEAGMIPLELAPVCVARGRGRGGAGRGAGSRAEGRRAGRRGPGRAAGAGRPGPPGPGDRQPDRQRGQVHRRGRAGAGDRGGGCRGLADRRPADSGIGIPPEEISRLFERFFRASNAATAGRPGSGLGLSIVKEVAEMHGGRVEVTSELGAGTTVHLFLPAQKRPGPAPEPAPGPAVSR